MVHTAGVGVNKQNELALKKRVEINRSDNNSAEKDAQSAGQTVTPTNVQPGFTTVGEPNSAALSGPTSADVLLRQHTPVDLFIDRGQATRPYDDIVAFHGDTPHSPTPLAAGTGSESILDLSERAENLQSRIDSLNGFNRGHTFDLTSSTQTELDAINEQIESEALRLLEQHLVETESGMDNVLSTPDLEVIAADSSNSAELRAAAQFYIDNRDARVALDAADNPGESFNEKFGIGDIQARRLEIDDDIGNLAEVRHSDGGNYTVPHEDDNFVTTGLPTPEIGQAAYSQQQDAVEEALRTGESVDFVNSNGDTVEIQIERESGNAAGEYRVTVDGEHSFDVKSEIAIDDTIAGLTTVINAGSSLNVAEGVRQFPDELEFSKDEKPTNADAAATYYSDHRMVFWKGDDFVQNQNIYNHEIAHGIGRDLDDAVWGPSRDSSPAGWPEVVEAAQADGTDTITEYSEDPGDHGENFAEAFSAYINARNHGADALEEFKQAYPHQSEYIELEILGLTPPT